jgi:ABC-type transport system involved in cytochrome bd biosynthesis fused ATPase/permease subunit
MLPRRTTVAALAVLTVLTVLAALSPVAPAWADHTTDHTIAQMTAQRLQAAPTAKDRDRIAREIRRQAKDKAREILHWYR